MINDVATRMVKNEENVFYASDARSGIGIWWSSKSRNQPDPGAHNRVGVFFLFGRLHLI